MPADFAHQMADILSTFEARERRMIEATDDATIEWAEDAVAFARANAPWQDASGDARAKLHYEAGKTANGMRVTLAHGVDYGVYLENSHGSRYAIIGPTMATLGPQLMQRLKEIWH